MGVGMLGQQALQDAGNGGGFARTGRAHHQEMLGQKIVDQSAAPARCILEQAADLDAGGLGRSIDAGQVMLVGQQHAIAQTGQGGNAAAKCETLVRSRAPLRPSN